MKAVMYGDVDITKDVLIVMDDLDSASWSEDAATARGLEALERLRRLFKDRRSHETAI